MTKINRVQAIFFLVAYAVTVGCFFLPLSPRIGEAAFLFALGVATFALIVSIALTVALDPLRDILLVAKMGALLLLLFLGRFSAAFWTGWPWFNSMWILFAGLLCIDISSWQKSLAAGITATAATIVSLFPEYIWVSMVMIAALAFAFCFLLSKTEDRYAAFFIASYATFCALSYLPGYQDRIPFGLFIPIFVMAWGYLEPALMELSAERKKNMGLMNEEIRLARVEERALKEEIRPHFLLNALNNVRVAYHESPEDGRELLDGLIALETKIAEESQHDRVPLSQEVEVIADLIRLFSIERKVEVHFDVQLQDPDVLIPPMLLEPLVENSLQHSGVLLRKNGVVGIHQRQEFGFVIISITDNGLGQPLPSVSRGIGLSNVMTRVQLLDEGNMNILSDENGTSIEVRFRAAPIEDNE